MCRGARGSRGFSRYPIKAHHNRKYAMDIFPKSLQTEIILSVLAKNAL